jgi:hypothetical protein
MIEIRTADNSGIDKILDLSDEFGLQMGVGSESCVHKLPSPDQVRRLAGSMEGLTVVTPITPQKHYRYTIEYIKSLPSGVRLVVNDMGILYALHKSGDARNFYPLVAGRGIVHTGQACPWADHLLRDESDLIKDAFYGTNLNYSRTLDLLKNMGITAMETDLESKTIEAAVKTGLPVGAHYEYIAVSYARSCHTARFFSEQPPHCAARCNVPIKLELVDMFDISGTPPGFAKPDQEMMDIFPDLYLLGSIIYYKSSCMEIEGAQRIIINADMYDFKSVKDIVMSFT